MAYIPTIPQATDTLADSQPQILANFGAIDTYFGKDHVKFSAAANRGLHNKISFVGVNPSGAIPITLEGITVIAEFNGLENKYELVYRQDSAAGGGTESAYALTNSIHPLTAANGYSYLPGGLLIQWGTETVPSGESGPITFQKSYDVIPFCIQLTAIRNVTSTPNCVFVSNNFPVTIFGFRIVNTASIPHDCYWLAIGQRG